jgi:non-ribosomal peptide synthetase component E (peptide arylation enzyme)
LTSKNKPWFNNMWPAEVPKRIKYPAVPLQGILQKTAKNFPANVAIAIDGKETTYAQLDFLSNQFAHALAKLGVAKGHRVGITDYSKR